MLFQDPPAAFDGVVFTVVGRIVDQDNFQLIAVGEGHHPFDELSAITGIFRTVIQIDDQLVDGRKSLLVSFPPVLNTIGDKVTGFPGGANDEGQQPTDHLQQTKGD